MGALGTELKGHISEVVLPVSQPSFLPNKTEALFISMTNTNKEILLVKLVCAKYVNGLEHISKSQKISCPII